METLDFDFLVKAYYEKLITQLRNFSMEPSFLEDWVHSENIIESLFAMFECAKAAKLQQLQVKISPAMFEGLDCELLTKELSPLGIYHVDQTPDFFILTMKFEKILNFNQVHPAYRKALEFKGQRFEYQGNLHYGSDSQKEFVLKAKLQQVELICLVDADGLVLESRFLGAQDLLASLLNHFCELLIARPIQENAEHSVIRLEEKLRSEEIAPPVKGVVTPQNADPIFEIPLILIRDLYKKYLELGLKADWNNWEEKTGDIWIELSEAEKLKIIGREIGSICTAKEIPFKHLELLQVKSGERIVIAHGDYTRTSHFGHYLMMIEKELKKRIEPKLQLVLEPLEDKNNREVRTERKNFGSEANLSS